MSTDFAYQDVDFGWDNLDDDPFRSFIEVVPGDLLATYRRFSFPGVNAEYAQFLGARGRSTVWLVDMVADAHSRLLTFENAMENLKAGGQTHQLTQRGRIFARAYIEAFERSGPMVALQLPWVWGQRYTIRFRILH